MIKQPFGNKLPHILHNILNGHLVIDTCRFEKVELLCSAKSGGDMVDTSSKVFNAVRKVGPI